MQDTYIKMENQYLITILKYENDPKRYKIDPMILASSEGNHVTVDDTKQWCQTQYKLFLDDVQEI
mgnify:CR=1 FL=1